jgi:hypothetical protein
MAFRTWVRTVSWEIVQDVGDLRSGVRHERDHFALAPRQRSRLGLRGQGAAERTSPQREVLQRDEEDEPAPVTVSMPAPH